MAGMKRTVRGCPGKWAILAIMILAAGVVPSCREQSRDRLPWVLQASWTGYRQHFITAEGRLVLEEQGGGTISEAQAYALLRAVWAGDEETFGRVVQWTRANLSREASRGDHLLAWKWGKASDGSWGVLDWNTASDADMDYALALLLASRQGWRPPPGFPDYLAEARQVARDILDKEVVEMPSGALYLAPGNWHEKNPPYLINPSYFFPAAYRIFAQAGFDSRWSRLHADAYPFLERLCRGVGETPGVGLVPDWVEVAADGTLTHPGSAARTSAGRRCASPGGWPWTASGSGTWLRPSCPGSSFCPSSPRNFGTGEKCWRNIITPASPWRTSKAR